MHLGGSSNGIECAPLLSDLKECPMTKVIIISGESLDGFYEKAVHYFHNKYHTHPTHLRAHKTPDLEISRTSNAFGLTDRTTLNSRFLDEEPPEKTP
jgi:hypothetical protein